MRGRGRGGRFGGRGGFAGGVTAMDHWRDTAEDLGLDPKAALSGQHVSQSRKGGVCCGALQGVV
jgi:hypothetical protein